MRAYLVVGWDSAAGSKAAVMVLAIFYIAVLTWICILGTELSARVQNVMILAQVGALLLFAGVALAKVWGGDAGQAIDPTWSWFSPFAVDDRAALVAALLIGVFAYWGGEFPLQPALGARADDRLLLHPLGVACIVYYRRELTKSVWNFVIIGVGPAVGALLLGYLFVEATRALADTGESYSGQEILGLAPPLAIGYGFLLLGVVLMLVWRVVGRERFFERNAFETVDPAVAAGAAPAGEGPVR